MRSKYFFLLALPCFIGGAQAGDWKTEHPFDPNVQDLNNRPQAPVVPQYTRFEQGARAARTAGGGGTTSPNMTNHGGSVMTTMSTRAVFWGATWAPGQDKITGLDTFFKGWGGSNMAKLNTEYKATATIPYLGNVIDTTPVPTGAGSNVDGSAAVAEVCKLYSNKPDSYTHFAVFSDTPRGTNGYCAFHGVGVCSGTGYAFTYSWYFNLDNDPGCDPQDTSGLHSQGLAALANVASHELSETVTDPGFKLFGQSWLVGVGAWYDSLGWENGDKCAWTFGAPTVKLADGTQWKLQGEWSNKAYTAGTGYPNRDNQKGCLAGGP